MKMPRFLKNIVAIGGETYTFFEDFRPNFFVKGPPKSRAHPWEPMDPI